MVCALNENGPIAPGGQPVALKTAEQSIVLIALIHAERRSQFCEIESVAQAETDKQTDIPAWHKVTAMSSRTRPEERVRLSGRVERDV